METPLVLVIILIILFLHTKDGIYEYFNSDYVVSSRDLRGYNVVSSFQNSNQAADKMAEITDFIAEFLRYIRNKYIINRNGTQREIAFVGRILENYNPDVIFENNPKPGSDTSFVVNKGDKFGICLRDIENKSIHDMNLLQYVILHELTHMGTTGYGHEYEFWSWFKFSVTQAAECGIYTPVDYKKTPKNYCGLNVTFNPYFSSYDWHTVK